MAVGVLKYNGCLATNPATQLIEEKMKKNHYLKYGDVDYWRSRLEQSPEDGHFNKEDWSGFEVYGSLPSPPCVKVAAYLRWKREPFLWRSTIDENMNMVFDEPRFAHIEERVMPITVFPNGRSINDSSFIIRAIEEKCGQRPVLPSIQDDPCLRFSCQLLEDFADEWLVRCVYGFRWNDPNVREFSGRFVALSFIGGGDFAENFTGFIVPRQLSTENRSDAFVEGAYTDEIIYPTFRKVSDTMEKHFTSGQRASKFMCGEAPASVDFAFFGIYYQFIQDKIPAAEMEAKYPATTSWVHRMLDTSGVEPAPLQVTQLLKNLLEIAGQSYLSFLQANAARLKDDPDNHDMISVSIFKDDEGGAIEHLQRPYPYQAKCLQWLQEDLSVARASEDYAGVASLEDLLKSTGCWGTLANEE